MNTPNSSSSNAKIQAYLTLIDALEWSEKQELFRKFTEMLFASTTPPQQNESSPKKVEEYPKVVSATQLYPPSLAFIEAVEQKKKNAKPFDKAAHELFMKELLAAEPDDEPILGLTK
jgi:hypothetical protein